MFQPHQTAFLPFIFHTQHQFHDDVAQNKTATMSMRFWLRMGAPPNNHRLGLLNEVFHSFESRACSGDIMPEFDHSYGTSGERRAS